MNDGKFEWDDRKSAANEAKHGISFEIARSAFSDVLAVDGFEGFEYHGEERYSITGMVRGRLLFVVYTMRVDRIRIISARKAEPYEQRQYHEESHDT
jgi:uncharacterized protein